MGKRQGSYRYMPKVVEKLERKEASWARDGETNPICPKEKRKSYLAKSKNISTFPGWGFVV